MIELQQAGAIRGDDQQLAMQVIGGEDAVLGIDIHVVDLAHIGGQHAANSAVGQQIAELVEDLDARVAFVRHVDIAVIIQRDAEWVYKFAGIAAEPAELVDLVPFQVVDVDPLGRASDIDTPVDGIDRAQRLVHLPRSGAFGSPGEQEIAR